MKETVFVLWLLIVILFVLAIRANIAVDVIRAAMP